ncbi:MAG: hypothetical protein A4E65_00943 [Syntrophorhabdus sp. PtaU1.Bin153]|nr:MAG: hypothetical protein A4E65_00943 [Syntrophorhabdus sp. PtaU1.Bin153]
MVPAKQKVYKKVYDLACADLRRKDQEERLIAAGLTYAKAETGLLADIPYFDEIISLAIPDFTFKSSKGVNVTLVAKIVLLHYILKASGAPLGGEKIPYEDIQGLRHYYPVFERRVLKPLQSAFGYNRQIFIDAGLSLGGQKEEYGDGSFTLQALPRVPITFILWEGDEEFPPSLRTLFDPSITCYLPLEDIVVISKLASTRILKEARLLSMDEVME